jgi:hypothetical protein
MPPAIDELSEDFSDNLSHRRSISMELSDFARKRVRESYRIHEIA